MEGEEGTKALESQRFDMKERMRMLCEPKLSAHELSLLTSKKGILHNWSFHDVPCLFWITRLHLLDDHGASQLLTELQEGLLVYRKVSRFPVRLHKK